MSDIYICAFWTVPCSKYFLPPLPQSSVIVITHWYSVLELWLHEISCIEHTPQAIMRDIWEYTVCDAFLLDTHLVLILTDENLPVSSHLLHFTLLYRRGVLLVCEEFFSSKYSSLPSLEASNIACLQKYPSIKYSSNRAVGNATVVWWQVGEDQNKSLSYCV